MLDLKQNYFNSNYSKKVYNDVFRENMAHHMMYFVKVLTKDGRSNCFAFINSSGLMFNRADNALSF